MIVVPDRADCPVTCRLAWVTRSFPAARPYRARRCFRWLRAGFCAQGGEPPELALRVPDDLVVVHCGAAPERGAVGGLAERVAGEGLGFADLQAPRRRATRIGPTRENDTMSVRTAPPNAMTRTGPSVLTVSSRTEPDASRPPGSGTLTLNDANPLLQAHKECRRTPERPRWFGA
jgi:hypothetical protein